jgi:hypothetical protein
LLKFGVCSRPESSGDDASIMAGVRPEFCVVRVFFFVWV